MSLGSQISAQLAQILSSDQLLAFKRSVSELNRKRRGQTHEVLFFHKVDDPYSYLLLQLLQRLMGDFDIKVKPRIVSELDISMNPEPELLNAWSLKDAHFLAQAFQLEFPEQVNFPDKHLCKRAEKILLSSEQSDSFLKFALDVNHALWKEGESAIHRLEQEVGHISDEQHEYLVKRSQNQLRKKGHYLSGTLFYAGEWYWGADRILHLAKRLYSLGIAKTSVDLNSYDYPATPLVISENKRTLPLDFYFSFRSPYSYLACQRLLALKNRYNLQVNVLPVLPMVMRNLPVPRAKKMYIFLDAKREANRYHLPFGKCVDPLGKGVERAMAIFPLAQKNNLALEYIASISSGTWAQGQNLEEDAALQTLVERAGLDWQEARQYLHDTSWQTLAENNRQQLHQLGFWGVPCFHYGQLAFWGQDRLFLLEQQLSGN